MIAPQHMFDRSIRLQIEQNAARTPTQRLRALCELLDAARAMAPRDPQAQERRRRLQRQREHDREQLRAHCRQLLADALSKG